MEIGKTVRVIEDEPTPIKAPVWTMPTKSPVREPLAVPVK